MNEIYKIENNDDKNIKVKGKKKKKKWVTKISRMKYNKWKIINNKINHKKWKYIKKGAINNGESRKKGWSK